MSTETWQLSNAIERFTRAHEESTRVGVTQGRCFDDLAKAIQSLADHGIHQRVEFADDLTEKAWKAYQEMNGTFVQQSPDEPPIPARDDLAFARPISVIGPGQ